VKPLGKPAAAAARAAAAAFDEFDEPTAYFYAS
jgi:hypothetical protein